MNAAWLEREVLITVTAYPNPSAKYFETVCVAGITREEGWVRLYPVQFRSLPEQQRFHKYERLRLRMRKHERDARPESYRPDEHSIQPLGVVGSADGWKARWEWIRPTVTASMCEIQRLQETERRSLACIKPRSVETFLTETTEATWSGRKKAAIDQMPLFDPVDTRLEKIPFVFRYRYRCEDEGCRGHSQSIHDWELMELYRKLRDRGLAPQEIAARIEEKFFGEICCVGKDTHFFVGNHSRYPGTFMILGVFWPPKTSRLALF